MEADRIMERFTHLLDALGVRHIMLIPPTQLPINQEARRDYITRLVEFHMPEMVRVSKERSAQIVATRSPFGSFTGRQRGARPGEFFFSRIGFGCPDAGPFGQCPDMGKTPNMEWVPNMERSFFSVGN
ncbi:hypothetical protein U1Q18_051813 [Sarracenia purpurea var. burkii]